jgi:multidrug efflux pump subunit AcrA (membrane-fusion protein)
MSVPESQRAYLQTGDTLTVLIPEDSTTVPAVLEELSPSADPMTRSLSAKLSLPQSPRLYAGQYARLMIPGGRSAGMAVPASAIVRRGQLELVFAVTGDNHASLKLVRTGRTVGTSVEILSGLVGDERVIVNPPATLGDHDSVEVLP